MKKLSEINSASNDCCNDLRDILTAKCELIVRLESEGSQPFAVGRSIVVIEQCEESDDLPNGVEGWNLLRISVCGDTDVYADDRPRYLYVKANRFGFLDFMLQERGGNEISKKVENF